jgi:WD40 repeat protein
MARVICQALSRRERLILIWSEGDAFFEPYFLDGSALEELRQRAAEAREHGANPPATDLALARAGHQIYTLLFQPDAGQEIRDWLASLEQRSELESLEILTDAPDLIPWQHLYDRSPQEQMEEQARQGFWGVRLPLKVARRVNPALMTETEGLPLPESPYRPLTPYDMEDRPLFVGREEDVARFAELLDRAATGLLLLHGASGAGKASLLRAGVIPFLEDDSVGYCFLRDRSEPEEQLPEADYPVLAIRTTQNLPGQLAQALCAFCARPYSYATPRGRTVEVDLPAILREHLGSPAAAPDQGDENASETAEEAAAGAAEVSLPAQVEKTLRHDPAVLASLLDALSRRLPRELVLLIEQGEELITLSENPRSTRRAASLLRPLAEASGHYKVIVSLRTDFFGQVNALLQGSEQPIPAFCLALLDAEALARAIVLPTAREPIPHTKEVPYEKYHFAYEEELPAQIAEEVLDIARENDSALPLAQAVCAQLESVALSRQEHLVTAGDLQLIRGIDGALERHVLQLINSISVAHADRRAFRALLPVLSSRLPDGTLYRELIPQNDLTAYWKGRTSLDDMVEAASSEEVRLLEVTWTSVRGTPQQHVSLSHDALLPIAARWEEYDQRKANTRRRVVDTLFITVPLILLALVLAYRFFSQASAAERELEVAKKLLKEAEPLKLKEAAFVSARRLSYAAHLGEAQQAWAAGNLVAFDQALRAAQARMEDEKDLRGFEWYYLWQLGHGERATLAGHRGLVNAVALSPDDLVVATGSADGTAKLWDAISGLERATLGPHKAAVTAVTFSGDGATLASADAGGTIRLWNARTGKESYMQGGMPLATLAAGGGSVRALAFSPDSKTLAAAGRDKDKKGVIRLWDIKERKTTVTLTGHEGAINAIAFAPGGKVLASGGEDHAVILWDLAKKEKQKTLTSSGPVNGLAFSTDGKTLAAGGVGQKTGIEIGVVRLWDPETGKERGSLDSIPGGVTGVAIRPGAKELITAGRSGAVQVWDVATARLQRSFKGHVGWIQALAVSTDGKTLVTGSYDRTAKIWDMEGSTNPGVLPRQEAWVCSVAVASGEPIVASGYSDGTIKLWNSITHVATDTLKGHQGAVVALAISPKGNVLASGSWDESKSAGELKLWDLKTAKEKAALTGHAGGVPAVAFSMDGSLLASGGTDGKVIVWDSSKGEKRIELPAHNGAVRSLAFARANILASGGDDTLIHFWEAKSGKHLALENPEKPGAHPLILEGHTGPVLSLAFAPDRPLLASASADTTVKVWQWQSAGPPATLRGHGGPVLATAFSPGGETVASAGRDGVIKLWDAESGGARLTLLGHDGPVRALSFSPLLANTPFTPSLSFLVSGGQDGSLRLWRAGGECDHVAPEHE